MKKEAKKLDELTIKKLNPKMWNLLYKENVKKKKKGWHALALLLELKSKRDVVFVPNSHNRLF